MIDNGITFKELLALYVEAEADRKQQRRWYQEEQKARWEVEKERDSLSSLRESLVARTAELEGIIESQLEEISILKKESQIPGNRNLKMGVEPSKRPDNASPPDLRGEVSGGKSVRAKKEDD
jgi:hypothetical protein